jgi:hypothetical protein
MYRSADLLRYYEAYAHAGKMVWAAKERPSFQQDAGQSCRSCKLGECCCNVIPRRGVASITSVLAPSPPPSCRGNELGAAGAEELVKGCWPELQLLVIRWVGWSGGMVTSGIQQHTCSVVKCQPLMKWGHDCPCSFNELGAEGAAHLACGRWPKLKSLDVR